MTFLLEDRWRRGCRQRSDPRGGGCNPAGRMGASLHPGCGCTRPGRTLSLLRPSQVSGLPFILWLLSWRHHLSACLRLHPSVCFLCCCHREALKSKPKHALLSLRPSERSAMGRTKSRLCLQNEASPERGATYSPGPFLWASWSHPAMACSHSLERTTPFQVTSQPSFFSAS